MNQEHLIKGLRSASTDPETPLEVAATNWGQIMAVKRLPDLPSDLLLLAMEDLECVEAQSAVYKVVMYSWHDPTGDYYSVCLAGAVMACSLIANSKEHCMPSDFDEDSRQKLRAIDYFRTGDVINAFGSMGLSGGRCFDVVHVPTYMNDPVGFFRAMYRIIRNMKNAGL